MTAPSIVIYRLGSLGDTVVALPCFHEIARRFPDHRRLVLTNEPVSGAAPALESVLESSGLIHGVLTYSVGERTRSQLLRLMLKLRATGAKTMIYLAAGRGQEAIRRDLRFFRLAGFNKIIGAPTTADLHEPRFDPATGLYEPEAARLARAMAPLGGIDLADRGNWDLRLTEYEHARAASELAGLNGKPFLAVNIGGKASINDWGLKNWKALFRTIASALPGYAAVAIGAPGDMAKSERLLTAWPSTRLNLCGRLNPRQSAAVLARARFFIGHDSGPMHLAASTGAPTLGLFGNNNPPGIWFPYGPACQAVYDVRGVAAITVEQVGDAVLSLAGEGGRA